MPRFMTIFADTNTRELEACITQAADSVDAILKHKWVDEIYKDSFVEENFRAQDEDNCRQNIYNFTSWIVLCVNLDFAIMTALNDGDSSACLQTQPN